MKSAMLTKRTHFVFHLFGMLFKVKCKRRRKKNKSYI